MLFPGVAEYDDVINVDFENSLSPFSSRSTILWKVAGARETRYSNNRKRVLSNQTGIQAFSTYLLGRKFKVQTDHRSLKWLSQLKESNSRLTRWSLFLQTYDFSISHRSGKKNANADTLSRLGHQTCLMQEKEGEMWEVTYTILELSGVTLGLSIDCSGTFMCHVKNCCLCCFWLLYWLLLVF